MSTKKVWLFELKLQKIFSIFQATCHAASLGGDVLDVGDHIADRLDGRQVHTDDQTRHGHVRSGHLEPAARRCAQIYTHARSLQEMVVSIQLKQLEGGSRSVARLLGQHVKLVFARFSGFRLLTHSFSSSILYSLNLFCL
jgi:hypothetical protein